VRHNAAVIARLASIDACETAVVPLLRETFGACVEAAEAQWAPVLVAAQPRGGEVCDLTVQWRVTLLRRGAEFEERGESTGRVARSFRVLADGDAVQQVTRLTFGAADYDRDRVPELVVTEVVEDHGVGQTRGAVEVYTGASGEVTVFDATREMPIVTVTDIDDDGRPDLVLRANYAWSEGAECGIDLTHWPVTQLAHALPTGGLSLDDAGAAQYLRQMCPGPDAPAVVPRGVDPDEAEGLGIVCRRLWGASTRDALAPLQCHSFRNAPSARCASSTQRLAPPAPEECPEHYQRWATAPVPLRLR
jgi:hypothetical protein